MLARQPRITDHGCLSESTHDLHRLLIYRPLDQHAGRCIARLPRIVETASYGVAERALEIRIGKDEVRRLAAEFLRDAFDGVGCSLGHIDAGAGRTGERHHLDERMGAHGVTHRGSRAVHHVEHARWQLCLVDELGDELRRERRLLARLEHDRAARRDSRRHLRHDLVDRPVPRRHQAAHTHGLTHHVGGADARFPVELQGSDQRRFDMIRARGGLSVSRHVVRRAHLRGDRVGHLINASNENRFEAT